MVDLPGYGYAKAPKHEQERWARMIENYLVERESLDMALLLVDGAVGPTALDTQTIEWLMHIGLPFMIVATKHDKVKPSKLGVRKKELALKCGVESADVMWVSAAKGTGIPELRNEVRRLLDES